MSDSGSGNARGERRVFDAWPPELLAWFDGRALAGKTGFTASLVTRQGEGRLGTSLLGIGELYAPDACSLRLALWSRARAARALDGGADAALSFVFEGAFYQVQLRAVPWVCAPAEAAGLICFDCAMTAGEVQQVPYARLETGITFTLDESQREATLCRWDEQIEWLSGARKR